MSGERWATRQTPPPPPNPQPSQSHQLHLQTLHLLRGQECHDRSLEGPKSWADLGRLPLMFPPFPLECHIHLGSIRYCRPNHRKHKLALASAIHSSTRSSCCWFFTFISKYDASACASALSVWNWTGLSGKEHAGLSSTTARCQGSTEDSRHVVSVLCLSFSTLARLDWLDSMVHLCQASWVDPWRNMVGERMMLGKNGKEHVNQHWAKSWSSHPSETTTVCKRLRPVMRPMWNCQGRLLRLPLCQVAAGQPLDFLEQGCALSLCLIREIVCNKPRPTPISSTQDKKGKIQSFTFCRWFRRQPALKCRSAWCQAETARCTDRMVSLKFKFGSSNLKPCVGVAGWGLGNKEQTLKINMNQKGEYTSVGYGHERLKYACNNCNSLGRNKSFLKTKCKTHLQ